MTWLNDPRIDELRNRHGKLSSHIPVHDWLKPERVTLRTPSGVADVNALRIPSGVAHANSPSILSSPAEGRTWPELEFVVRAPWKKRSSGIRPVRPTGPILEEFLGLATDTDEEIRDFASKFGPLLIFYREGRRDQTAESYELVIIESCEIWRYFAASMRSLLHMAAKFQAGQPPDGTDWDTIGKFPLAAEEAKEGSFDLLSPSPVDAEAEWKSIAGYIRARKGRMGKQSWSLWARLMNALLELGRVRPWLLWDAPGRDGRPKLVFSGPNLLSYLALQLCLSASKHDSFAVCSYCNREYPPSQRAPKAGQRNFCPECRDSGIPLRLAQRARRQRLRDSPQKGR
jgi:hypothetical protein